MLQYVEQQQTNVCESVFNLVYEQSRQPPYCLKAKRKKKKKKGVTMFPEINILHKDDELIFQSRGVPCLLIHCSHL